jgi:hypothetical protein
MSAHVTLKTKKLTGRNDKVSRWMDISRHVAHRLSSIPGTCYDVHGRSIDEVGPSRMIGSWTSHNLHGAIDVYRIGVEGNGLVEYDISILLNTMQEKGAYSSVQVEFSFQEPLQALGIIDVIQCISIKVQSRQLKHSDQFKVT